MKIAFVLDDSLDKTDGVQQYILTLGNWYRNQNHEVHYLVGRTERTDIPNIHSLGRNIRARFNQNRVSTPLPVSKRRIQAILAAEQFNVLHIQLPYSPLFAARVILAASPQTAVIGTFHIVPFSHFQAFASVFLGLMTKSTLKRFDQIFSVSKPAQTFAKSTFDILSDVIPNTVTVSQFKSAKPYKEFADNNITIVFIGRLVERKGCLHLLRAIELLYKQGNLDRVRVLIGGKGPLKKQLEAFVADRHLSGTVQFLGYVTEDSKAKYLASADIAVFPSTGGESFGIVLLEAMAAGSRAILAGNNAGYQSVMGDQSKQLIDPENTQDFAKCLHHFITSSSARDAAYAWQQQQIASYDVEVVGTKLLACYETVIAKRNQSNHNNR